MLKTLGLTKQIIERNINTTNNTNELARVIAVHKDRYNIRNSTGVLQAEITGNLRYSAQSNFDFPAVGDWVQIVPIDNTSAIIHTILNRYSTLERKAVGTSGENQLIATNIDTAFITMAVNQDFNLNRLDRYIAICNGGGIEPVVLLTKTDLVEDQQTKDYVRQIKQRHTSVEVLPLSITRTEVISNFKALLKPMKTYCFIGSSGVGKSTLVNALLEEDLLKTNALSIHQKGKHTTTYRALILLPNGSIVIDTPGMKEVGMSSHAQGIGLTFESIVDLANNCKFSDCTHINETECAVLQAIESGELSERVYDNYIKLKREEEHYAQSSQTRKQSGKKLSKLIRKAQQQKGNFK